MPKIFWHSHLAIYLSMGAIWLLLLPQAYAQLLPFKEHGRWGICSAKGERLTDGWDSIAPHPEVCALWRNGQAALYHHEKKLIEIEGFSDVIIFDSLISIKIQNKWGLLDKITLETHTPPIYDTVYQQGQLLVVRTGTQENLLSARGRYLMPNPREKRAIGKIDNWVVWHEADTLLGLLRPNGAEIPTRYRQFAIQPPLIWAQIKPNAWHLYDTTATLLYEQPMRYAVTIRNGYALNMVKDKWGVLNAQGKWCILPEYDAIEIYGNYIRGAKSGVWEQRSLTEGDSRRVLLLGAADDQSSLPRTEYASTPISDLIVSIDSILLLSPDKPCDNSALSRAFPGETPTTIWYIKGTLLCIVSKTMRIAGLREPTPVYGVYDYVHEKILIPLILKDCYYEDLYHTKFMRCITYDGKCILVDKYGWTSTMPTQLVARPDTTWTTPGCIGCWETPHVHAHNRPDLPELGHLPWPNRYIPDTLRDGHWGLIHYVQDQSVWLIKPTYAWVSRVCGGYVAVKQGNSYGLYNLDTKRTNWTKFIDIKETENIESYFLVGDSLYNFGIIMPGSSDTIYIGGHAIGRPDHGLIPTREMRRWGFKTSKNEWFTQPEYDELGQFSDGFAPVRKGNRWGYINKKGKAVIRCNFSEVGDFYRGRALVQYASRFGIIDTTGRYVIEPKFQRVLATQDSLFVAGNANRCGLYTLSGQTVLAPRYREIAFCGNYVRIATNGKYGYATRQGEVIASPSYDYLGPMTDSGAVWMRNSSSGILLSDGTAIERPIDTTGAKMPPQNRFLAHVSVWRQNKNILYSLYDAKIGKQIIWNIKNIYEKDYLIMVEGDGWLGYFYPNRTPNRSLKDEIKWFFLPDGAGQDPYVAKP